MNRNGPIVIIEDDLDDQENFLEAFQALPYANKIIMFTNGLEAFQWMLSTDHYPFLIISDINMPKLDGIQLRDKIHNDPSLRTKTIPYIFFTTSGDEQMIRRAYEHSAQGYFVKPNNMPDLIKALKGIVDYWSISVSPAYTF